MHAKPLDKPSINVFDVTSQMIQKTKKRPYIIKIIKSYEYFNNMFLVLEWESTTRPTAFSWINLEVRNEKAGNYVRYTL